MLDDRLDLADLMMLLERKKGEFIPVKYIKYFDASASLEILAF